jgi:hypothetical protein
MTGWEITIANLAAEEMPLLPGAIAQDLEEAPERRLLADLPLLTATTVCHILCSHSRFMVDFQG